MKRHLEYILLIVVGLNFVSLGFSQVNQSKLEVNTFKDWKVVSKKKKIIKEENQLFTIDNSWMGTSHEIYLYRELPMKMNLNSKYQIEVEYDEISDNIDIGILFLAKPLTAEGNLPLSTPYPQISLNYDSLSVKNSSNKKMIGFFTSKGLEETICITLKRTGKFKSKFSSFRIKKLKVFRVESFDKPKNLLINGGFEDYHLLSYYSGLKSYSFNGFLPYWNLIPDNYNIDSISTLSGITFSVNANMNYSNIYFNTKSDNLLGTPDLYGEELGTYKSKPYEGRFFAGINLVSHSGQMQRGREYLQLNLRSELEKDTAYKVSFAYRLPSTLTMRIKYSQAGTNVLGVKLSQELLPKTYRSYDVKPMSTSPYVVNEVLSNHEWKRFEIVIIARGGEKFLTIGDFRESDFKVESGKRMHYNSYYFIDDIKVEKQGNN